jgi:hypothetical protein
VAAHEYAEMFRDVADSSTWRERLSFVLRGPGWAYDRHRLDADSGAAPTAVTAAPEAAIA